MEPKAVVLFSGGQDSTVCLLLALQQFDRLNVFPLAFNYGQRHVIELEYVDEISKALATQPVQYLATSVLHMLAGGALTNKNMDVSNEAGDNEWAATHGLPSTFVPGRNLIFLSLATAYAAKVGAFTIITGGCKADYEGYPDCREDFYFAMEHTIRRALGDNRLVVAAPLVNKTKSEIFKIADEFGELSLVLEHTHTCYHGKREKFDWGYGCGECPACVVRKNGWEEFTGAQHD